METPKAQDYLHLHFIVLIWGFTSVLGMLIHVPSLELVLLRTVITAGSWALILGLRRQWPPMSAKRVAQVLGAGVLIALHWLLFFYSARVSNISTCLAGIATAALWTSILDPLLRGGRFKATELVLGMSVLIGLNLIVFYEFDKVTGLAIAIVSALFSAVFSICNAELIKQHPASQLTFLEMVGALVTMAIGMGLHAYLGEPGEAVWVTPTLLDWVWLLVLALGCTVYAYAASLQLMRKFTPFAMNLTINLEPVYGIILAVMVFGDREKMTLGFYAGTVIILASVFGYPYISRRFAKPHLVNSNA